MQRKRSCAETWRPHAATYKAKATPSDRHPAPSPDLRGGKKLAKGSPSQEDDSLAARSTLSPHCKWPDQGERHVLNPEKKYQPASTFKQQGQGKGRQVAFRALSYPKSTGLLGGNGVGAHCPPGILGLGGHLSWLEKRPTAHSLAPQGASYSSPEPCGYLSRGSQGHLPHLPTSLCRILKAIKGCGRGQRVLLL